MKLQYDTTRMQARIILGIGEDEFRRLIASGQIPPGKKVKGELRWCGDELRYMKAVVSGGAPAVLKTVYDPRNP